MENERRLREKITISCLMDIISNMPPENRCVGAAVCTQHVSRARGALSGCLAGCRVACCAQLPTTHPLQPLRIRRIPLATIAARTKLSVDGVEFLLMKALSLHLIEGVIDEVGPACGGSIGMLAEQWGAWSVWSRDCEGFVNAIGAARHAPGSRVQAWESRPLPAPSFSLIQCTTLAHAWHSTPLPPGPCKALPSMHTPPIRLCTPPPSPCTRAPPGGPGGGGELGAATHAD